MSSVCHSAYVWLIISWVEFTGESKNACFTCNNGAISMEIEHFHGNRAFLYNIYKNLILWIWNEMCTLEKIAQMGAYAKYYTPTK